MTFKKFLFDVFLSPDADSPDWIVVLHAIWCLIALCLFAVICWAALAFTPPARYPTIDGTESVSTY